MKRSVAIVLYSLVFLTGAAGLIYQVVWQQYLARILGSEHAATAIVLAIFLGGLAMGFLVSGALSRWMPNALACYAALEGIIGLWALAFPSLFRMVDSLTSTWSFASPYMLILQGSFSAALLLGPPTICMGGTVPLLTRALSQSLEGATSVHARVYAINTLGAFVGTLAAGFVLIPMFGLPDTLRNAAVLNLAAASFFGFRARVTIQKQSPPETFGETPTRRYSAAVLYGVAFLSGAYVMTLENVLIRTTDLAVGPSTASFSLIVGVFVLCIGGGSLVLGAGKRLSPNALIWNQVWLSIGLLLLFTTLDKWPYAAHIIRVTFQSNIAGFWSHKFALLGAFTLLLALPIGLAGATLPIAFHELRRDLNRVGWASGMLFFWNLIGAVVGSLVGGWLLYLWIGNARIFLLATALAAASATLAAVGRQLRLIFLAAAPLLMAILLLAFRPMYQPERFATGTFRLSRPTPETWHGPRAFYARLLSNLPVKAYRDGPGATVAVVDDKNSLPPASAHPDERRPLDRAIYVNGKSDSSTYSDRETLRLLAHLGPMFSQKQERVLLVGLGTGVSAGELSLWPQFRQIVVAELLPEVSAMLPFFSDATHAVQNDPRLDIRLGDAFRVLRRSNEKWDVIVSEPPNLWVRGTSQLFSRDFYAIAKSRLNTGGVFVQWLEGYTINEEIAHRVAATLRSEFENVAVFRGTTGDFLFVATPQPLAEADLKAAMERAAAVPPVAASLNEIGVSDLASLADRQLPGAFLTHGDIEPETLDEPQLHYLVGRSAFMPDTRMAHYFPAPANPPR
jgi:spermidine synthase